MEFVVLRFPSWPEVYLENFNVIARKIIPLCISSQPQSFCVFRYTYKKPFAFANTISPIVEMTIPSINLTLLLKSTKHQNGLFNGNCHMIQILYIYIYDAYVKETDVHDYLCSAIHQHLTEIHHVWVFGPKLRRPESIESIFQTTVALRRTLDK